MSNQFRDIVLEEVYGKKVHEWLKQQALMSFHQGREQGWNEVLLSVHQMCQAGEVITPEKVAFMLQSILTQSGELESAAKPDNKPKLTVVPVHD